MLLHKAPQGVSSIQIFLNEPNCFDIYQKPFKMMFGLFMDEATCARFFVCSAYLTNASVDKMLWNDRKKTI